MKTADELLAELNELDEHASIEAKTASDVGKSLLETICAFSNEPHLGGGYILLGVAPDEDQFWPTYEVIGVSNPDKLQADIASQCATRFNVPVRPRITPERLKGKTVIALFVPEVSPHEKPVHFKNQPLPGGAFRRIGSTDQRCTDDDLVLFYQDREGETHDEQVLTDADLSDFDPDALNLYRQLRREIDGDAEELRWSDEDLLRAIGAAKYDKGILKPTVGGILLLGSSRALRQFFPMMRIDYIRVPGTHWVEDPERRFDTVEIRSPLIRAVQRARAAILDDLPRAFSLPAGEIQRRDIPLLPDRVIREVVANAVMHRSYRVHGTIQIIRYSNRLEIRNPGYSLKAEERLGEPGSEQRNPKIAAAFHDIKFAETKGSGIRVMRELMAQRNLSPPYLQSDRTGNCFIATLLFHHFLSQDDLDWLTGFAELNLCQEDQKALVTAREVEAIDNSSYRDLNRGVDTLNASKHLRRLCDLDLLQKRGQGSHTYYVPTAKLLASWNRIQSKGSSTKPGESGPLSPESGPLSPESGPLSPESGPLSPESGIKSSESGAHSNSNRLDALVLPDALKAEVQGLGRRAKANEIREVAYSLCSWRDLTLPTLANLMNRTQDYVRKQVVSPMLKAGQLQFTIPDEPNHPRQSYRAVPKAANRV